MQPEENQGVLEGDTPDPEQQIEEVVEEPQDTAPSAEEPKTQSDKDYNWAAIREANERYKREAEYERKMREQYEAEIERYRKAQEPQEPDELDSLSDDDWMTFSQYKKASERLIQERVNKALQEAEMQRSERELPQRLKTTFPDFDTVVTEQNVQQLIALEPELAQAVEKIGDKYAQAVAAYKYIKAFIPQATADTTKANDKIAKNLGQPKAMGAATASSPLATAASFDKGLTPEMKKQLYAEMEACARRS
jgi:hypothetical protein